MKRDNDEIARCLEEIARLESQIRDGVHAHEMELLLLGPRDWHLELRLLKS